jgi:hypothetical protein
MCTCILLDLYIHDIHTFVCIMYRSRCADHWGGSLVGAWEILGGGLGNCVILAVATGNHRLQHLAHNFCTCHLPPLVAEVTVHHLALRHLLFAEVPGHHLALKAFTGSTCRGPWVHWVHLASLGTLQGPVAYISVIGHIHPWPHSPLFG